MVQFFQLQPEYERPRIAESLGMAGRGAAGLLQLLGEEQERRQFSEELFQDPQRAAAFKFKSPELQLKLQEQELAKSRLAQQKELETRDYEVMKQNFGERAANLWRAQTTGGRTEMLKDLLDAARRGEKIENVLSNVEQELVEADRPEVIDETVEIEVPEKLPQMVDGKLPKDYKMPVFTKKPVGYTPKEWAGVRKDWRKENIPVHNKNKDTLKAVRESQLGTKSLINLNKLGKLPEGMASWIIDKQGKIRPIAELIGAAPPEAQQWVKEIARFQKRAKEYYGSRVTNFDLMSYMEQFPDLLNTKEGRSKILKMMDINYQLDELHANALSEVYRKYGLDNIPQEKADELAEKLIEERKKQLENEYLAISGGAAGGRRRPLSDIIKF